MTGADALKMLASAVGGDAVAAKMLADALEDAGLDRDLVDQLLLLQADCMKRIARILEDDPGDWDRNDVGRVAKVVREAGYEIDEPAEGVEVEANDEDDDECVFCGHHSIIHALFGACQLCNCRNFTT